MVFDTKLLEKTATVATSVALVTSLGMTVSKHNKVNIPDNVYSLSTFSVAGSFIGAWLWYKYRN